MAVASTIDLQIEQDAKDLLKGLEKLVELRLGLLNKKGHLGIDDTHTISRARQVAHRPDFELGMLQIPEATKSRLIELFNEENSNPKGTSLVAETCTVGAMHDPGILISIVKLS